MVRALAIDCDDVIAETCDAALAYHNYQFNGKPIQREAITNHAYRELPEFKADLEYAIRYFDSFFQSDAAHDIPPVAWAKERLRARKGEWYTLYVVTARNEAVTKSYTHQRVNNHFEGLFEDVLFASHHCEWHREKSELCEFVWASLLIDDSLSNVLETAEKWIDSILFEKPWNRGYNEHLHAPIKKVSSRDEITEHL